MTEFGFYGYTKLLTTMAMCDNDINASAKIIQPNDFN
jgi:hypothetical protein